MQSDDPKKTMGQISIEINKDLDDIFKDLLRNLKRETPVDKGTARRGWKYDKQPKGDKVKTINRVIVNEVPYIEYLDQGSSKQAPNGIVEQAISKTLNQRKR